MVGINKILNVGNEYVKCGSNWISDIRRNLKWLKRQENHVHIEVLCILESQFWNVRVRVSGFIKFENIWHDWNYKNANNLLGFKLSKNMHIKFLCIFEVAAGKSHDFISNWGKPFVHCSEMTVSTRDRLHNSSFFFQINTPTITLTLHCSSTMAGGHEKQIDSNTTSSSSSASASAVSTDWDIALPLRNVRVDIQYVGIIEKQKQQIR